MIPYNDEICAEDLSLRQSMAGAKPPPLRSSWGMGERRETPPPRKAHWVFYIDTEDGITVGKQPTLESGYRALEAIRKESGRRLVLRPHLICEETLQAEESARRRRTQYGY